MAGGRSPASEPSPLRVLHLITRLEPGGAQRNTLYTVEHLDRCRFRAGLVWGPGDPLDEQARSLQHVAQFELPQLVRAVRPGLDLSSLVGMRRALRQFRPRVVHTHSSKAGILGRLAARLEGVPVVVHSIHGFGFTPLQPAPVRAAFFAAEKLASRWTHHFIAVARADLERGLELGLFAPHQVSLIRSGIPLRRYRGLHDSPGLRQKLGLPETAPLITQVGNFKAQKAPLDFVRVAAAVCRRVPEAHAVMVGEGPLKADAEALASELDLAGRLHFCGWIDTIPELLAASSVSVLSSRHEGLPRAVVESLAAGVPVVATAVDGTVEVVEDGVNGFLVPAGAVKQMAERVCMLLADEALRSRMSRAAPSGLEDFDIDLMVRQQEELYTCLSGRSRS